MTDLTHKKCVPCEGGIDPMSSEEVRQYLVLVEGWESVGDKEIRKDFVFKDFGEALKFVNAVGEIAEAEGHHPDILLHAWKKVEIRLSTHAIDGLHLNDFILASKIDQMRKEKFHTS